MDPLTWRLKAIKANGDYVLYGNLHATTGGVVIPLALPEGVEGIGVRGTTISDKKYSWKRESRVSSG